MNQREIAEYLSALLLTSDASENIELSRSTVAQIVSFVGATPEGRTELPKEWTHETEVRAIFDMLHDKPINVLAREIAAETGQLESSADRRLRALKKSKRFTDWRRG